MLCVVLCVFGMIASAVGVRYTHAHDFVGFIVDILLHRGHELGGLADTVIGVYAVSVLILAE